MCFVNRCMFSLQLLLFVAATWCRAAPLPETGLVIHEWGTFSTFSGSNGTNLKFYPYDDDLPEFVHGYQLRNSKKGPEGGTISLETPVLYFYSERPLTASVRVDFPKGILTEWFPHAGRSDHQLSWEGIKVRPADDAVLPKTKKESRYYAARETDAAPLSFAFKKDADKVTEQEKFLFYRGVGSFAMPLSVRALGNGKFTARWNGKATDVDLLLVQVQGDKIRFKSFRLDRQAEAGAEGDVQIPDKDASTKELGEALVKQMTGRGLYEKEARAMVKTWSSAWFGEEGTRVLYFLPGELTDELLPLKVEPKPATLVRVLVGRHDVLTPEREKQIDGWVAELNRGNAEPDSKQQTASKEMAKLGRYQQAACEEAEARSKKKR